MDAAAYLGQLTALLPPGQALARRADGRAGLLLGVAAAEFARIEARGVVLRDQADPRSVAEMIDDWERALGLPDECAAGQTLLEQRRAAVLARLTERLAPTPATIEAVSLAYGVRASVIEFREHNCEQDCEAPVNGNGWPHAFTVWGSGRVVTDATCEDGCEQPLRAWSDLPHECAVRRLAPAHTVALFDTFQDEWDFLGGLPAGATFTRAGAANRVNHRGYTESMAADVPRLGYRAGLVYNELPDPWFDGFTLGGAAPNTAAWAGAGTPWTNTVTDKGLTPDGLPFVTIAGARTPSNTNGIALHVGGAAAGTGVAAAVGEVLSGWIGITFLASEGLSATPALRLVDAADTFLTGSNTTIVGAVGLGEEYRRSGTRTAVNANVTQMAWALQVGSGSVGVPVAVTARMIFPVLHKGASPLTDTIPLATLAARVNGVPQYGLLGLMLEAGAGEELRLAVPDGAYTATIEAATPAGAVASYPAAGLVSANGSLRVDWPAAATLAGANHLRRITLRKVA